MAREVQYVTKGSRSGIYLTDYQDLLFELNRIQPTLVKQLQKDYRKIAKPVKLSIQNKIPDTAPLSGFIPKAQPGRVTWGANYQNKNKNVNAVAVQLPKDTRAPRTFRKYKTNAASVARLKVENAGVVLADMAGKNNSYTGKYLRTREYDYSRSRTGKRSHAIRGQGVQMIRNLRRKSSRYVWPAVEESMPRARAESKLVLQKAFSIINKRMVS
jgi:hypothetical protein